MKNGDLYIELASDHIQSGIWIVEKLGAAFEQLWYAGFSYRNCGTALDDGSRFARAVRSGD